MFYTYIIKSQKYKRFYVGSTQNIRKRLKLHNTGKVRSTKVYRPWKIIYIEEYDNRNDAYRRELQIKSYKKGEAFNKLILPS